MSRDLPHERQFAHSNHLHDLSLVRLIADRAVVTYQRLVVYDTELGAAVGNLARRTALST